VRTLRARKGMSRKVLATQSGVSERHLAQLEGGSGNISILLLSRIAAAIGTRLETLVADTAGDELASMRALAQRATPTQRTRMLQAMSEILGGAGDTAKANRIALVGLRGAGKSTLGRLVAEDLDVPFVELDTAIEAEAGLPVPEIFSLYGQEGYRRLERNGLRLIVERHDRLVLAVAGGIVAEPDTFELLLRCFHTVWLAATPDEHMARVHAQGDHRPMADDPAAMDELRAILGSREALYARADHRLDTGGQGVEESRRELRRILTPWLDERR
jgi:XRE family aerobic/anaerobic benzoate catabolism transcriptional regulator